MSALFPQSTGALDTFDTDGKTTTPIDSSTDEARAVAVQSDGKIVALGSTIIGTNFDFAVVRYGFGNADGGFSINSTTRVRFVNQTRSGIIYRRSLDRRAATRFSCDVTAIAGAPAFDLRRKLILLPINKFVFRLLET